MEPAGLAMGVVGVAALFDGCMSAFNYVESGKSFGKDYQKATLKIEILQLRLSRWGESVTRVDEPSQLPAGVALASEQEHRTVEKLLGEILNELEDAERISSRYEPEPAANGYDSGCESIESLTVRTRELALTRQKKVSFGLKAKWALHHKGKLKNLIDSLDGNVKSLVELFPGAKQKQQQLARQEATALAELAQDKEAVLALKEASQELDPDLDSALYTATSGHSFGTVFTSDTASIFAGNYVAHGYTGPISNAQHRFENVQTSDQAKAFFGNQYGGKHIFDD
ncbi:hypothetical protein DOTSEDRAFT_73817 [Dothistroma septosporum NZE10]|uniref:Prion-inhibition and propagation HeLo domain-containing protein n=1 Tax=Dothistroma septosporum (strain NZE10 / CBS 128990) TaxID=675120 RepID=N1PJ00_DOTSN|nr:hypothetical protein DOTSEDRAFT_73817 [Dothistroma septosporum NZE10]